MALPPCHRPYGHDDSETIAVTPKPDPRPVVHDQGDTGAAVAFGVLSPLVAAQQCIEYTMEQDNLKKRDRVLVLERPDQVAKGAPRGRNDPCHCGSRKKFKRCHGR
jgi:uncharacterized protein YchJ